MNECGMLKQREMERLALARIATEKNEKERTAAVLAKIRKRHSIEVTNERMRVSCTQVILLFVIIIIITVTTLLLVLICINFFSPSHPQLQ